MSEEVNLGVEEEILEAVPLATESAEHDDGSSEAKYAEHKKRNDAEHNWAEMRRLRDKDRHEMEELKAELNRLKHPQKEEEDILSKLAKDDIITVEQAERLAEIRARKVVEEAIRKRDASTVDERLQFKFPDYADVVTRENIELAEQLEPELAEAIGKMDDPYKQRVSAYKLLKRVTANRETGASMEKKKALINSQKPLSVNAVTKQSAIGNAHLFENGLTKELKSQLWKEMQDSMKAG